MEEIVADRKMRRERSQLMEVRKRRMSRGLGRKRRRNMLGLKKVIRKRRSSGIRLIILI